MSILISIGIRGGYLLINLHNPTTDTLALLATKEVAVSYEVN